MKRNNLLLLLLLIVVRFSSVAQQDITLTHLQTVQLGSGRFFDQGGENGEMPNEYMQATIKAPTGYIHAFFTAIDIPSGSELRIYKGSDTLELLSFYDGTYKPMDFYGKGFTIVYDPKSSVGTRPGFAGMVQPVSAGDILVGETIEKATLPESDCVGAIPLCSNLTVNTSANQYENTGNVNDDNGSCYSGTGNGGSVWYSFSPQSNGNLDFMINPTGSTDYDFVLWDITNGCANKTQLSCNYSATQGATGLNASGSSNSQDAQGTTNNSLVSVQTTKVYALCINYYGGNNAGFTLNFHNIASTVNIVDNIAPTITNAYSPNCAAATSFTVNFSEYIDCNTLQASDFVIPGYTVSLITTNCINGKTNTVVIGVSPSMPPGNYSMTVSNMNDMCGNPLNQVYPLNTLAVPVVNAGPDVSNCRTPGFLGIGYTYSDVTLTATGNGTSYLWNTSQTGASITVNPSSAVTYTVTAINGACSAQDQVVVTPEVTPAPNLGADRTVCQGASVNLTATGGGNYQWQSTTSTNFFGQPSSWNNIGGATASNYSAAPPGTTTIYYQVNVTSPSGYCTGSDYVKFTIDPISSNAGVDQLACASGSPINLSGTNTNGTTFSWNVGSPSGAQVATTPTTTVNPVGTTNYYYTATSATGCSYSDMMSVTLADYGAIPAENTSLCDLSAINMVSPPNMVGATQFTFTWYSYNGSQTPCPTSVTGGTQVFQETKSAIVNQSLYNENFNALTTSPTLGAGSGGWSQQTVVASVNNWSIGSTGAVGVIAGKFLEIHNGSAYNAYNNTDDANQIAKYGPISTTNASNIVFSFNWKAKGETSGGFACFGASANANDYLEALASTDGITWASVGGSYYNQTSAQTATINLPSTYNNSTLYIGFRWVNNGTAACTSTQPAMVDNVNIQADIYQAPMSSYNPPLVTGPTSYALQITPVGGTCNGISSFMSNCQISCFSPLPVDVSLFDGKKINERENQLFWTTQSERENQSFSLERSVDMVQWERVVEINGNGTTSDENSYQTYDTDFEKVINYYRLVQKDFNGQLTIIDDIVSIDNRMKSKKIIRRTNLLGQIIPEDQKGLVILIYEDGTSERVMLSED